METINVMQIDMIRGYGVPFVLLSSLQTDTEGSRSSLAGFNESFDAFPSLCRL